MFCQILAEAYLGLLKTSKIEQFTAFTLLLAVNYSRKTLRLRCS